MKIEGNIKQLFYVDIIDKDRWIQKGFDENGIKFEDREINDIQGNPCVMKYAVIRFNKNAQGQSQASGKGGVVKIGYICSINLLENYNVYQCGYDFFDDSGKSELLRNCQSS